VIVKLFGREPAIWVFAIYSALMMLAALNIRGFDGDLAAAVQLLLTTIATAVAAWHVRPIAPTVFTGVITAAAALLSRYGWHLDEVQIAGITSFVASAVVLVGARPQQTPISR